MKISDSWLRQFIKTDLTTTKIGEYLTDIGLEVEGIEQFETVKGSLKGFVVGKILTCEKHPNADKLKTTIVDIGNSAPLHIVCGAPNVEAGQIVAVATIGTKIFSEDGSSFEIKSAKIRGEKSEGMLSSEKELGIGDDQSGILVLDADKFEVGKQLSDYFSVTEDSVYEIGLTPNRTDAMSHYGVARDLNAFLVSNNLPTDFEKIKSEKLTVEGENQFKISVENDELSPRYIGAVIQDVQVTDSPAWLQNKLKSIGLSPINNIVDVTNYILHGLGQPLHAFDAGKISDRNVIVGTVENGTKMKTLDGVERTLNGAEIIIKDGKNNPLCMAGVLGGIDSGVSAETKNIFLESAYFNPVAIRKAAKAHNINSDASFRFERGIDPNNCRTAITHAIKLIEEIANGKLEGDLLEHYPKKIEDHYIILRFSKIEQILGTKIHREKVKEILKSLEITVLNEIQNGLELSVPAYRVDVTREIDVIEEILRIYGYNKIDAPQKLAFTPVKLLGHELEDLENHWARTLQSLGFSEVMNNSLTCVADENEAVKLINPLSNELAFMRKSLLEGLLENAAYNINRKSTDIRFFEIGNIYFNRNPYEERKQMALIVSGRDRVESWKTPKNFTDFYYLKGYVRKMLEFLNVDLEETSSDDKRFTEAVEISSGGKTLAVLGKVNEALLKKFDVDQPAFYAEVELKTAQELRKNNNFKFVDIPKFNKIRRDLALLLDKEVSFEELKKASFAKGGKLLKSVQLFDVYEGNNLPEGKKSYALSFELLDTEKTLEEKEISNTMEKLIATFQKDFGAQLR